MGKEYKSLALVMKVFFYDSFDSFFYAYQSKTYDLFYQGGYARPINVDYSFPSLALN